MAAPLQIKRLSREDFKDAPAWIERLIIWLNQFVEYVGALVNNGISLDANVQAQVKSFEVLAGAAPGNNTLSFACTMRVAPRMLFKGSVVQRNGNYVALTAAVDVFWRYESGTIFITSITGLTAGLIYDFVVLLV